MAAREELHDLLEQRTLQYTGRDLEALLTAAEVPAAPVNDLAQTVEHPLMRERRPFLEVDGDRRLVRLPFQPPDTAVRSWPPGLGEHTREVLAGTGLTEDEIDTAMDTEPSAGSAGDARAVAVPQP